MLRMLLLICGLFALLSRAHGGQLAEELRLLQTEVDLGRPSDVLFVTFKKIFNKSYEGSYEEETRKAIFDANIKFIRDHNKLYASGDSSYFMGVNQFADLTHEEYVKQFLSFRHIKTMPTDHGSAFTTPSYTLIPPTKDWRNESLVTGVKDQGPCGSCWAFSTTGSLEGQYKVKTGKLVSLSEQQLVDCSGTYGNMGCNGGLMYLAFEYIKAVGGLESEADYPYKATVGTCRFDKRKVVATLSGYMRLPSGSESTLQLAVATVGPISVGVDASSLSFLFYSGGVYDEPNCSSTELDHAVLVVGYGDFPQDYWIVKNSWGTSWGESGYIRMSRNMCNQCGIATDAIFPLV